MKVMSTSFHGTLDYLLGIILIAAPWLFGFAANGAETWVPVIVGAGVIMYSIFTDYEKGLVRTIPMKTHLWLDGLGGLFLAVSPWLFGFAEYVWVPHLVVGAFEFLTAIITRTVPERRYTAGAV